MASPPKISPRATTRVEGGSTTGSSTFPGFQESWDGITRLQSYLQEQGVLWNAAWSGALNEEFTFQKWLATMAKSADAHWRYARGFLPAQQAKVQAPPWMVLQLEAGEPEATSSPATISGIELNPTFDCTDFCPLSAISSVPEFAPTATKLGDGRIEVKVDVTKVTPRPTAGRYISFAFAAGKLDAPVLIILLEVKE